MEDNPFFAGGGWIGPRGQAWRRSAFSSQESLHVWVSPIEAEARQDGLDRQRLKAEVEWQLARAGLPVSHQPADSEVPVPPCLGVILHLRKADVTPPSYTYSIEVFFVQGHTPGEPAVAPHIDMTWCREAIGDIAVTSQGADWSGLCDQVSRMVDSFIRDYLARHPAFRRSFLVN